MTTKNRLSLLFPQFQQLGMAETQFQFCPPAERALSQRGCEQLVEAKLPVGSFAAGGQMSGRMVVRTVARPIPKAERGIMTIGVVWREKKT